MKTFNLVLNDIQFFTFKKLINELHNSNSNSLVCDLINDLEIKHLLSITDAIYSCELSLNSSEISRAKLVKITQDNLKRLSSSPVVKGSDNA